MSKYPWSATEEKRREERRTAKPKKVKLVTLPKLQAKAQIAFNSWIRNRDAGKPCVSCGSFNTAHASHFYPAGKYTSLRFNELNCHLSCMKCNTFEAGNLHEYRRNIVSRIGQKNLDLLDMYAVTKRYKKWNRAELELIIEMYSKKKYEKL